MRAELIKELCIYLGELDYIVENTKDSRELNQIETLRESVHFILNIPYVRKRSGINYKQVISKL